VFSLAGLRALLANSTILITGGTGSFGIAFVKRALQEDVKAVRVYSRDELKQHELRQRIDDKRVRFLLGDVRDLNRLTHATRGADEHHRRTERGLSCYRLKRSQDHRAVFR
jgi:FlaA1/EpsC-like NDP-sugar epimerase